MISTLSAAIIYLVLFGLVFRRRAGVNRVEFWLLIYCGFSAALMGIYAFLLGSPAGALPPFMASSLFTLLLFTVSTILTGVVTLAYLGRWLIGPWGIFSSVFLLMVLIGTGSGGGPVMGAALGLTLGAELAIAGWLVALIGSIALVVITFLAEPLPLYANRILFWAVVLPILLIGDLLTLWTGNPSLLFAGFALRLLGTIGAVYGVLATRILDLREAARWVVSRSILTLVTGLLVLIAILIALYFQPITAGTTQRTLVAIGVSILIALVIAPVLQGFRWLLRNLISRDVRDVANVVRNYSQRIGGEIELDDLANTAIIAVNDLLTTKRGYLILATPLEETIAMEIVGVDRAPHGNSGAIFKNSPVYDAFINAGRPILQYDIDYQRAYTDTADEERAFFKALNMDIYAPIIAEGKLLGMLAVGPKANDDPFTPNEIELLEALANQTVAALENARLINDLRLLNRRISALNENLTASNERLEKLDHVKTDFIAIASHELRTPLTQIQGYADLLLEMAKRNVLDPNQTEDITRSLGGASQRMAEVIGSMLDVSQIDVENMDLNFVETNLANILKLAIDPYAEAVEDRNLTLIARGLSTLPPVNADYKRLVQAFQNLITNAVKYTPDGGQITVTGSVFERDPEGEPLSVRVTIADTGIGVDPANHELIFEKFFRVGSTMLHSSGETKFKGAGPGLGLPITKGIIEGHGGRIWVESGGHNEVKLPGSAFNVILPIHPPAIDARERLEQMQASKDETLITPLPGRE